MALLLLGNPVPMMRKAMLRQVKYSEAAPDMAHLSLNRMKRQGSEASRTNQIMAPLSLRLTVMTRRTMAHLSLSKPARQTAPQQNMAHLSLEGMTKATQPRK